MSPEIFAWESVADQTDHFADAFVPEILRTTFRRSKVYSSRHFV